MDISHPDSRNQVRANTLTVTTARARVDSGKGGGVTIAPVLLPVPPGLCIGVCTECMCLCVGGCVGGCAWAQMEI